MRYLDSLLSSGETVQLAVHQHWITLLRSLLLNGALFAVLVLVAGFGTGAGTTASLGRVLAIAATVALLVPLVLVGRDIARWSARQYVVTTRRVLEIDGVFNRRVSDSNLDKVNDLVLRQSFVGRLLGYGDIEVEVYGAEGPARTPLHCCVSTSGPPEASD